MLDLEKMWKCAKTEAEWLKYYGHQESRLVEDFSDANFYDRIQSIGYTKKVISLHGRCTMMNVTSDKPVLESKMDELRICNSYRDHNQNIYTALEYFIGTGMAKEQLIKVIRGEK
jgi:hypothetical protein